jgi:hypothetical protein
MRMRHVGCNPPVHIRRKKPLPEFIAGKIPLSRDQNGPPSRQPQPLEKIQSLVNFAENHLA